MANTNITNYIDAEISRVLPGPDWGLTQDDLNQRIGEYVAAMSEDDLANMTGGDVAVFLVDEYVEGAATSAGGALSAFLSILMTIDSDPAEWVARVTQVFDAWVDGVFEQQ